MLAKLDTVIRPNERTGEFEAAVMVTLVGPCPNPDTIEKVSWDLGSSCGLRQTCRNEVIDIGIPDIRAGVLYPLPEDVSGFLQSETRDK